MIRGVVAEEAGQVIDERVEKRVQQQQQVNDERDARLQQQQQANDERDARLHAEVGKTELEMIPLYVLAGVALLAALVAIGFMVYIIRSRVSAHWIHTSIINHVKN